MKTWQSIIVALAVVLLVSVSGFANTGGLEILGGTSWKTSQAIRIGKHHIADPQWETRPFTDYPYFSIRLRWGGHEIEWLHDKVYMGYDTPEIQGFNMSDGYNMLIYNVPQVWGRIEGRIGVGVMIVHAEGVVDGVELGSLGTPNWDLAGVGIHAAVGYRQPIFGGVSAIVEGKLTTAFAHIHRDGIGDIFVPVTARHLTAGLAYDF